MNLGESDAGVTHPFTQVGEAAPLVGGGVDGSAGGVAEVVGGDGNEVVADGGLEGGSAGSPWHAAASTATNTTSVMNLRTYGSEHL